MAIDRDRHDLKDLDEILELAIELWNDGNYEDLAELFDVDIIMKKLDDPGSVNGMGNALVYLKKNQYNKKPKLTVVHKNKWFVSDDKTLAQITGVGKYIDKLGEPELDVHFTFTFTRDRNDREWLLVNAFQAYKTE
jgi:hypothetical protein